MDLQELRACVELAAQRGWTCALRTDGLSVEASSISDGRTYKMMFTMSWERMAAEPDGVLLKGLEDLARRITVQRG